MTPEEYAAAAAVIAAATAVFVQKVAQFFMQPLLSVTGWVNMLEFMYPFVEQKRRESAELARTFYDSQRAEVYPELPRHDVLLETYSFETFVKDMEPARKGMQAQESTQAAVTRTVMLAVRDVETAGRRQIIRAVETDQPVADEIRRERASWTEEDLKEIRQLAGLEKLERQTWGGQTVPQELRVEHPKSSRVQGWARVATGRETCAWCLMLISRGPVGKKSDEPYGSAANAGVREKDTPLGEDPVILDDEDIIEMFEADPANYFEDIEPFMDEWHTGCDCKVVPVFDVMAWTGRDEAKRAKKYWKDATKAAKKELRKNPDKTYYAREESEKASEEAGERVVIRYDVDLNRETINQLRQMIDQGKITTDWAAISLTSSPLAA